MAFINKNIIYVTLCVLLLSACQRSIYGENQLDEKQQEYILTKVNNYQGLVKLYREKLSRKEDPTVRFKLAEYYNLVGDYDSSLHYLEPLIENRPNDKVYLLQAKNLSATGKDQQALAAITSALKLNAKNGEAYNMLGVLQAQQGEFNAAYQSFNTARALFVPEEQVVNNLAMLMILQENYQQAYSYLMPLYLRGHSTPSIIHNLVFVLVKMDNYEEADNLIRVNGLSERPEQLISELMSTATRVKRSDTEDISLDKTTVLTSDEETPTESIASTIVPPFPVLEQKEIATKTALSATPEVQTLSSPIAEPKTESATAKAAPSSIPKTPAPILEISSPVTEPQPVTATAKTAEPPASASNTSSSIKPLDTLAIDKLVQPPPIMSGVSAGTNSVTTTTRPSTSSVNSNRGNINEVTNARFGTHSGFSRLTLESLKNINFEKVAQNENTTLQVILNNTRQGNNMPNVLSKITRHIGNKHRDIKKISIEQKEEDSLLITFHFIRDMKVNIFKIPAEKNKKERLVFDFI
ncbi:hypothetical protein I2494_07325 [Budviciaceae bacterium BWR-B9]|uniref:Tetratricopeptide repeat protein n=1 Tax=Limnobaculum allomyrinae TaxID=2791986 RepID=A0ABS1IP64_9GAMM|nr:MULTISPECIES: hypothetical protein [Limnobaculum]MBK5143529.1 hypothetical protein [Limnobaculum allomyrinae]MBV7691417.1 hypothetical protein [Limnobaculum sp. M2-1]